MKEVGMEGRQLKEATAVGWSPRHGKGDQLTER